MIRLLDPSAFPLPAGAAATGMSLRDYFAAVALQGLISSNFYENYIESMDKDLQVQMRIEMPVVEICSQIAYEYADAMMKLRSPQP